MERYLILSAHWEEADDGPDRLVDEVADLIRPRKVGHGAVVAMTEEQTRQRGLRRELAAMQLGDPFEAEPDGSERALSDDEHMRALLKMKDEAMNLDPGEAEAFDRLAAERVPRLTKPLPVPTSTDGRSRDE